MKEIIIPICTTVGYMLKVLKSNVPVDQFDREFKMIRHGDYFGFINSINGEVPFSVEYNNGILTADNIAKEDDVDFKGLMNAGPSLKIFYDKCYNAYGEIKDSDIPNSIYGIAALFEISLKMHANNYKLIEPKEKLINIIDKLGTFKNLSSDEIETLHGGRKFLNMIKHFKSQFPTWQEGADALTKAYEILKKHNLKVV